MVADVRVCRRDRACSQHKREDRRHGSQPEDAKCQCQCIVLLVVPEVNTPDAESAPLQRAWQPEQVQFREGTEDQSAAATGGAGAICRGLDCSGIALAYSCNGTSA